jgi:pimeloyl-ACP methyl ester carboxylesterase
MRDFSDNVTRARVDFRGRSVSCYSSGCSERPIVLLHGSAGGAANSFWALQPMFAKGRRVISFDFLDPIDEEPTEYYVAQVEAVIASLLPEQEYDLLGYSFGAVIAVEFALRPRPMLTSLILLAGWAKTDAAQLLRNDIWQQLYRQGSTALGAFATFCNFSRQYLEQRTAEEIEALVAANQNGSDRLPKMIFNRNVDLADRLSGITVPTLVVACTMDQTSPPIQSLMLFGGIPSARLFEINTGHGVVHERPSEVVAVTNDFTANPEAVPAGTKILNEQA